MTGKKKDVEFNYRVKNDTLILSLIDSVIIDSTISQFTGSYFIVRKDGRIYNCTSGYTYLDNRFIHDKYIIYVLDGGIFKQKAGKVNGYGLITKEYKQNKKLRRKLRNVNENEHIITVLKGRIAYEKYDLLGMNGVIEIDTKKNKAIHAN